MATPLLLFQQVFSALTANQGSQDAAQFATNSVSPNSTVLPQQSPFPTDLSSLVAFLVSFSALRDWLKLLVFGTVLETCRRLFFHFYFKIYNSFFITAQFNEDDASFDWMMVWLSKQASWREARHVQISTRTFGLTTQAVMIEGEEEDPTSVMSGSRPLAYLPSLFEVHSFFYKRRWIRVTRSSRDGGYYGRREEVLEICILTRDHKLLNELLIEAKKTYQASQEHLISIYVSDTTNNWRHIASRPKRPLTSIVLDPGIKDLLVDDARDFLESKRWYSARGIPFRRGYLLYGAPGSGKTSIIHSLAGELGLDVYVISLSRVGLDDTALSELISELPEKCIALMEDIDAAFSQTINRDKESDGEPEKAETKEKGNNSPPTPSTSRISLSGLLNALDGVGAQEGRILFATTNKYASLDPALCRPGRMDIHVEFKLASKYQARELYRCFYLPDAQPNENDKDKGDKNAAEKEKEVSDADSGYSTGDEKETPPPSATDISSITPPSEKVTFSGSSHRIRGPQLSATKIDTLAAKFAAAIPDREFSMATLQGYLMAYKVRPFDAIKDAPTWVVKERDENFRKKVPVVQAPSPSPKTETIEKKEAEKQDT